MTARPSPLPTSGREISTSSRNTATLGSLRNLKSPPKLDHLALNDVRLNSAVRRVKDHDLTFPDPATLAPVEASKRLAAHKAVDDHFPKNAQVIGIGSGSTVIYAVERILMRDDTSDVTFIPTGFQSKELITGGRLRLGEIDGFPTIDVAFDGADEVDASLQCIKGGGACLFQEKLVASCAKKFVIVADYRKNSKHLGEKWAQGVPIEVVPLAHAKVIRDLLEMGAQEPALRMGGKAKAGPVLTDNANFIIDAPFPQGKDPKKLEHDIKQLVGVVECGLFVGMAEVAYFGNEDGSVDVRYSNGKTQHIDAAKDPKLQQDALAQESTHVLKNGEAPELREPRWKEYDRFELRR